MKTISAPTTHEKVARRKPRRVPTLLTILALLLLLATVPPLINLGRYQRRIAGSISRSLGRSVSMDSVSLRLLPWPAFKIENLSIGEDPNFGAEPTLRAPEVIAEPRLSSLWRGRFELSRVELSDASVNLVRTDNGRWNISSVLLQASHIQNAPTAQTRPGPAPRFPYIQATGTRINFKRGIEKLPYSLLNADFSMSLARPEVWQVKLRGQPVRTDLELSLGDTGLLRIEGEVHRASAFGTMPLSLQAEWSHAPLGQFSRLLLGHDSGWRGDIDVTAQLGGEVDHLDLRTHLLVANLHRQEFTPRQPFTVDATCRALYSRSQSSLNTVRCRWPMGDGALLLVHTAGESAHGLTLAADKVPAGFLAQVLGLLRPGAPKAQRFAGEVDGSLAYDPATNQLTGALAAPTLSMEGAGPAGTTLVLKEPRLRGGMAANMPGDAPGNNAPGTSPENLPGSPKTQPTLVFTSQPVTLGLPATPMTLSAELSLKGYTLHLSGMATLLALQAATSALHLPGMEHFSSLPQAPESQAPEPQAENEQASKPQALDPQAQSSLPEATAQLALTTSAPWLTSHAPKLGNASGEDSASEIGTLGNDDVPDSASANTTGTAHLQNVRWQTPWLSAPVEFTAVDAVLSPAMRRWTATSATLGEAPYRIHLSGTAQTPLHCKPPVSCVTQFSLSTPSLDAAVLQAALGGNHRPLLFTLFNRGDTGGAWPMIAGSIHASVLTLGLLPIHDVSLVLSTASTPQAALQPGSAQAGAGQTGLPQSGLKQHDPIPAGPWIDIQSLDGRTLGGSLHLEGTLSLADAMPRYDLHARLTGASAAQASTLWREDWGHGTLDATARFSITGITAQDLLSGAKGSFHASWLHGGLNAELHNDLPSDLLHFAVWDASGTLDPNGLTLDRSTFLGTPATAAGAIGWDRALNLQLLPAPSTKPTTITGTLAAPIATPPADAAEHNPATP